MNKFSEHFFFYIMLYVISKLLQNWTHSQMNILLNVMKEKKIVFCETINSSIWWLVKTLNALAKVNHWNDKHYFVTTTIIFLMRLYTANIQWQLDMTSNHLPVKQEGNIHVIAGNKECYIMQIRSSNFPICQIWV